MSETTDATSTEVGGLGTSVAGRVPTAIETDTEAPTATKRHATATVVEQAATTDGTVTQAGAQHQRTNRSHTVHEDPSAASSQFNDGQIVWAKCGNHPHWPARISG